MSPSPYLACCKLGIVIVKWMSECAVVIICSNHDGGKSVVSLQLKFQVHHATSHHSLTLPLNWIPEEEPNDILFSSSTQSGKGTRKLAQRKIAPFPVSILIPSLVKPNTFLPILHIRIVPELGHYTMLQLITNSKKIFLSLTPLEYS